MGDDDNKPQGGIVFGGATFGTGQQTSSASSIDALPPFRLLIVGDYGATSQHPIVLDPHEFKTLPATIGVDVSFETPNLLGDSPPALEANLVPKLAKDISFKSVLSATTRLSAAEEVLSIARKGGDVLALKDKPAYAGLEKLFASLNMRTQPSPSPEEDSNKSTVSDTASAQQTIGAPSNPEIDGEQDDDPISRLLGMVESASKDDPAPATTKPLTQAERSSAEKAISAFISASSTAKPKSNKGSATAFNEAETLYDLQCQTLLTEPTVKALVQTWAGLRFLVSRVDFRSNVQIELLSVPKDKTGDALEEILASIVTDLDEDNPYGAIVVSGNLKRNAQTFELLQLAARSAEAAQTPVIFSLDNRFPEEVTIADLGNLDEPGSAFSGPGFEAWSGLRMKEESRWITVTANEALLDGSKEGEPPLWIEAGLVLAVAMAASVKSTGGWPSELTGAENAVDGFDVQTVTGPGKKNVAVPTRGLLGAHPARGLAATGIAALVSKPNRDGTFFLEVPSVLRSSRSELDRPKGYFESLSYQLVASRLVKMLAAALPTLMAGRHPQEAADHVAHWLNGVIHGSGPGATANASIEPDPDDPDGILLSIVVRMGGNVLNGEHFHFDFPVR